MSDLWRQWVAEQHGTLAENGELALPDEAAQLAAVRRGNAWAPLTDYALLHISGEDAATFLQGQFSSDVRQLDSELHAQYSSYSTAKGRMLASFLLWRQGGDYYLLLARDLAADTVKRLSMFVLRAKVKIVDVTEQTALVGVLGAQAEQVVAPAATLPLTPGALLADNGVSTIRLRNGALLIVGNGERLVAALADIPSVGSNAWRLLDLTAGIVWVRAATKEGFVPQMANMDVIGAVSFTKGCYPGQEVVARAQYRGQIKRHLYRIESSQPLQAGDELASAETGEQAIGLLADVCQTGPQTWQALAVVQDAAWADGVYVKARSAQHVNRVCRQSVLIRPYLPGDQQRVLDIWMTASRDGHPFLSEDDLRRQYAQVRDEYLSSSLIRVAERNGELLGFISLRSHLISGLFIDPQAQGSGIGGALIAQAATLCGDLQVEVYVQNERALAFYRMLGFSECERKESDSEGRPLAVICLRRSAN